MEDPEYTSWKRKHPKFPGVAHCVVLLRRPNVTAGKREIVYRELIHNAAAHAAELIEVTRTEPDAHVQRVLINVLCEARLADAVPFLVECLGTTDADTRHSTVCALRGIDTPAARKALWDAGLGEKSRP